MPMFLHVARRNRKYLGFPVQIYIPRCTTSCPPAGARQEGARSFGLARLESSTLGYPSEGKRTAGSSLAPSRHCARVRSYARLYSYRFCVTSAHSASSLSSWRGSYADLRCGGRSMTNRSQRSQQQFVVPCRRGIRRCWSRSGRRTIRSIALSRLLMTVLWSRSDLDLESRACWNRGTSGKVRVNGERKEDFFLSFPKTTGFRERERKVGSYTWSDVRHLTTFHGESWGARVSLRSDRSRLRAYVCVRADIQPR